MRIRKEVSPSTKASPVKTTLSKKITRLINIRREHQPNSSTCPFLSAKKQFPYIYIYIYIYMLPNGVSINIYLITVFLVFEFPTPEQLVPTDHSDCQKFYIGCVIPLQ